MDRYQIKKLVSENTDWPYNLLMGGWIRPNGQHQKQVLVEFDDSNTPTAELDKIDRLLKNRLGGGYLVECVHRKDIVNQ